MVVGSRSLPSDIEAVQSSFESAIKDLKAAKTLLETQIESLESWKDKLAQMHEIAEEIAAEQ